MQCERRHYWAGKFGRRSSRRHHYAPERRCSTDDRRHDGMMQVLPPSLRPHSRQLESVRTRFDYTRSAVSDRDAVPGRRASSFGYPFLSRSCDPSRRAPARRFGASRRRTEESPSRADQPTIGFCYRSSSAPRLSPVPPRPASVSPSHARSRSSPRDRDRTHRHAHSTHGAESVSARAVVQFQSPESDRCSSVLARLMRRRVARW